MALSKKHYIAIAKILRDEHLAQEETYGTPRTGIAYELARYFEQDNPAFDFSKFMAAALDYPVNTLEELRSWDKDLSDTPIKDILYTSVWGWSCLSALSDKDRYAVTLARGLARQPEVE